MKKFFALLMAVMMLTVALTGCGAGNTDTTDASENGADTKVITVATNAYFPPYEFYDDNNEIVGIDMEIMQLICNKLGYEMKIEDMEFDTIIAAVQSGKAQVGAAGMTVTEDRLLEVNFSDTYTTAKQVIIVPEDSAIKSADDLTDKKIGVQLGTTGDIYISGDVEDGLYGNATVEQYQNGITAVQALSQGKIDAVIIDNEPAKVFVEQNEGLKILEAEYIEEEYAFAIAKDNTELLDEINATLADITASGELQAIVDKYITAE
ncbi:MAG: basic amino acid ABC transporter substrate-binding protein [Clostridia bacterium]|nr:basic amino acid ABC transporter substrate-binding protein [Clostridia bacterium]